MIFWEEGDMPARMSADDLYTAVIADRIRCDERTGCWLWQGPLLPTPVVSRHSRLSVRRLLWERLREPLPADVQLRRRCAERKCVNPAHMTRAEPGAAMPFVPAAAEAEPDRLLDRAIARLAAWDAADAPWGYRAFHDMTGEEE
jgi:hypothetical protein